MVLWGETCAALCEPEVKHVDRGVVRMLTGFANPWEHMRLLSDPVRNAAYVEMLERNAPGNRVLEVGCGTGLLSVIAARLGAVSVVAVEPTPLVEVARELVLASGLGSVVTVVQADIEDVPAQEVDFAFSELLNADPWIEGVVSATHAAQKWVGDEGVVCPQKIEVWGALVRANGSALEARSARTHVEALCARFDLPMGVFSEALRADESYRYFGAPMPLASAPVLLDSVHLLGGEYPKASRVVNLVASEAGPVAGVVVWFSAQLDGEHTLSNGPVAAGHWGQLVCAWDSEVGLRKGEVLSVDVRVEDDQIDVVRHA